jgi:hypothetical protein
MCCSATSQQEISRNHLVESMGIWRLWIQQENVSKKTIDEYIETFPEEVQSILEKMRQTIRRAPPEAEEASAIRFSRSG